MSKSSAPCSACGSTTKIIRTITDTRNGQIKRRRECRKCGARITTIQPVPALAEDKPPLSAAQAARVYPRAYKAAYATRLARPDKAYVSFYPELISDIEQLLSRRK